MRVKKIIFLISIFCQVTLSNAKTIYILPFQGASQSELTFDPTPHDGNTAKPFMFRLGKILQETGYEVKLSFDAENLNDAAAIIVLTDFDSKILSNLTAYPTEKCFLYIFEPPTVRPDLHQKTYDEYFGKIFTMFDDDIDQKKRFKFYYPQNYLKMFSDIPDFSHKKLCAMISGNKNSSHPDELYSHRKKVISFFSKKKGNDFDLYGAGWPSGKNYKGSAQNKYETLKNYRFSFTYENMQNQNGYITEKIFDSLVAGCIPIYLGASNITDSIPENCFIDRRKFGSENDLYNFMKEMNRETFENYLKNIRDFLSSDRPEKYSTENFSNNLKKQIEEIN
jgi:hypothetical protein